MRIKRITLTLDELKLMAKNGTLVTFYTVYGWNRLVFTGNEQHDEKVKFVREYIKHGNKNYGNKTNTHQ
jgi:hypothetical protein